MNKENETPFNPEDPSGATAKFEKLAWEMLVKQFGQDRKAFWPHPYFIEYLLGLGRGEKFLSPLGDFPRYLQLNSPLLAMIHENRNLTARHDKEHHVLIATDQNTRELRITDPVAGKRTKVPGTVIRIQRDSAIAQGYEGFVASGHTHPHNPPHSWERFKRIFTRRGKFSVADLYCLVYPNPEQMMILVEDEENRIAFRSRETAEMNLNYLGNDTSQESFIKFWYSRWGIIKEGNYIRREDGLPVNKEINREIEKTIAIFHSLAIYSGSKTESILTRLIPPHPFR